MRSALACQQWFGRADFVGFVNRSWIKMASLCSKTSALKAIPVCRMLATLAYPPNCSNKASPTWCASATDGGTAFGTVIVHVAPESAIGGTLALVQEGDMIKLDVANRSLHLDVSPEELAQRRQAWQPLAPQMARGYVSMYLNHVQQADTGVDFDFLVGKSGAGVPETNH